MIAVDSINISEGTPTTFQRLVAEPSIFEGGNNLTRITERRHAFRFDDRFGNKNLNALTSYTNFRIETPNLNREEEENIVLEDFDFYVPLKPKKSFVVKAKVVSIKKFTPTPFFD